MESDKMKDLIHMVSSLQEAFLSTGVSLGLELPRIAVVGGQSAGKSSVLECFVGKDFLPRGTGIVTRRPLVLQLHHSKEEYATFLHTEERTFTVGEEVRREIEAETERETGNNKGISRKPIHLRIFSPHVLDLTLVDLPGMTKVAVGDQPEDIELQIRSMILEYVAEEDTIILAVTPANQDIANSDSLKLAREVDRAGNRTIGVISKLDLMDRGTDARNILENKVLPLKKGYIGVVCRSQQDTVTGKTISSALASEKEFLLNGPYRSLAGTHGTRRLQELLHQELGAHIRTKVPGLREHLSRRLKEVDQELQDMGWGEKAEGSKLVYRLVLRFADRLNGTIDGAGRDVNVKKVNHGAIINQKFYTDFSDILSRAFADSPALDKEIALAVANSHGTRTPLFAPEPAFRQILQLLLSRYSSPLAACVALIRVELEEAMEECLGVVGCYPRLREEVRRLVGSRIAKGEEETVKDLRKLISAQKAFMNTRHPDFRRNSPVLSIDRTEASTSPEPPSRSPSRRKASTSNALTDQPASTFYRQAPDPPEHKPSLPSSVLASKLSSLVVRKTGVETVQERILGNSLIQEQTSSLKRMVEEYLRITDTTIRDLAPKYVMLSLVNGVQDYVREELPGDLVEAGEDLVERADGGRVGELLGARQAVTQALAVLAKL